MSTRICPSCDEPVAENDRICDVCNTPLRQPGAASTASLKPNAMTPIILPAKMPDPPALPAAAVADSPTPLAVAEESPAETELPEASPDHDEDAALSEWAKVPPEEIHPPEAETPVDKSHEEETLPPDEPAELGQDEPPEETVLPPGESNAADHDENQGAQKDPSPLTVVPDLDTTSQEPEGESQLEDAQDTVDDGSSEDGELQEKAEDAPAVEEQQSPDDVQPEKPALKIEMVTQAKIPPPPMDMPAAEAFPFEPQDAKPFSGANPSTGKADAQTAAGDANKANPLFNQSAATPKDLALQIKKDTLATAKQLTQLGYQLYGLFGRPSAGKSSMIYALRQHFLKGDVGFGGYTPEGPEWDVLAKDLEEQWAVNRPVPTKDKLHPFRAISSTGRKHIALLDIAGERFEGIQNWTEEIFDFFDLYFDQCKGMFFLVELDDLVGASRVDYGASMRIQSQMARIIRFLAVAGNRDKWRRADNIGSKRAKLQKALQQKNVRIEIPVALCLTKADAVGDMNFGPALGRIIPGSHAPESDPWNVLQAVWPEHVSSLLKMVPYLKVDWLSCLGTAFESEKRYTQSVGLRGVFQHVVLEPPKPWTLSTKRYLQWQKWLRL